MGDWRRCAGRCRRVLALDQFEGEGDLCRLCRIADDLDAPVQAEAAEPGEVAKTRPRARRGPQPGTVRRPDARARAQAIKRLIDLHRPDYDRLFQEEMRLQQ